MHMSSIDPTHRRYGNEVMAEVDEDIDVGPFTQIVHGLGNATVSEPDNESEADMTG